MELSAGLVLTVAAMTPRDHHYLFAKQLIPGQVFKSTDRMFAELTGPQREAFLFFLWGEAGKTVTNPLPHVAQVPGEYVLAKLDVVGAIKNGGREVVVISMPPATSPNEASFIAPVRGPEGVRVFFYERCRDEAGTGVSPSDCVLAEVRQDGTRVNHGFLPGVDLAAFKGHLGKVLGFSLDGLEASLPAVTAEAFVAAGRAKKGSAAAAAGSGGGKHGFDTLIAAYLGLNVGMYALWRILPSLALPIAPVVNVLYSLLAVVIGVSMLVWLYRVHAERREQASFSPGMAVGGWFIPIANVILPPLILRSAWRAYHGSGGGLAFLWWLLWLLAMPFQMMRSTGGHISVSDYGAMIHMQGLDLPLSREVGKILIELHGWSFFIVLGAYGLLWVMARGINDRRA